MSFVHWFNGLINSLPTSHWMSGLLAISTLTAPWYAFLCGTCSTWWAVRPLHFIGCCGVSAHVCWLGNCATCMVSWWCLYLNYHSSSSWKWKLSTLHGRVTSLLLCQGEGEGSEMGKQKKDVNISLSSHWQRQELFTLSVSFTQWLPWNISQVGSPGRQAR